MSKQTNDSKKVSSFLSILDTWPSYFENWDEGLGTTYERVILQHYFAELKKRYDVQPLLEAPSFGMTGISGINSLWWAAQGLTPTVVDDNEQRIAQSQQVWDSIPLPVKFVKRSLHEKLPFADESFDLSWNFASLWFIKDVGQFAAELKRVTRKALFICVPNRKGVGYKLRYWLDKNLPEKFYPQNINPKAFVPHFTAGNWKIWRQGYLDIPPWPDIAMKKEDMLRKAGLGFLFKKKEAQKERTCIVDYFNGSRPQLTADILKYSFLEHAPFPVKQLWGHHRYFIFEKG